MDALQRTLVGMSLEPPDWPDAQQLAALPWSDMEAVTKAWLARTHTVVRGVEGV